MTWRESAACRGRPTRHYFPTTGGHDANTRAAIDLCWTECPVRPECLTEALNHPDGARYVAGIWGGFTLDQRLRLLRKGHPHDRRPK